MNLPGRQLFGGALLLLATAHVASGCIRFHEPGKLPGTNPRKTEEKRYISNDERTFPKTWAILTEAEAALKAKDGTQLTRLGRDALAALEQEYQALGDDRGFVANSESHERLWISSRLVENIGMRLQGEELEAVLAWGEHGLPTGWCEKPLKWIQPSCQEHTKHMLGAFPRLTSALNGTLQMVPVVGIGKHGATADLLSGYDKMVKPSEGGIVGISFGPTSLKTTGDHAQIRVDGEAYVDTSDRCFAAGKVRIGRHDFDLARCFKQKRVVKPGHLVVNVPADMVTDVEPGDGVFVVFDAKGWRGAGAIRTIGKVVGVMRIPGKHRR